MQQLPQALLELIHGGENLTVEFKKSRTEVTKDVYETVCAFSNREGGHIFLGVKDNGEIPGIEEGKVVLISLTTPMRYTGSMPAKKAAPAQCRTDPDR